MAYEKGKENYPKPLPNYFYDEKHFHFPLHSLSALSWVPIARTLINLIIVIGYFIRLH